MRQVFKSSTLGLLAASFALASCGPIVSFGDEGPADTIYTLRYQGGYADGNGPVVYVDEPTVADGLKGEAVAVALPDNQRSTIGGVRWSAPVSDLTRDYFTRSFGSETDALLVGDGGLDIRAACRLGLKVWELEYVPGERAGNDRVSIAIEMSLVRLKDNHLISKTTFSQTPTVAGEGTDAVMAAFNDAMADLSGEAVAWFSGRFAQCDAG